MKIFKTLDYFDISTFSHKGIFNEAFQGWEVLSQLLVYINALFPSGQIKGNDSKNVFIGEGAKIESAVEILGPAIIGANCHIGHASFIREFCLLGDNVSLGHGVEVKNSILLNNAKLAHLNYVGDSIIGGNVNLAGGAKIANYRLDKKTVTVRLNDEKIDTKLNKFGAVVGDFSNIGVNAVLNPGTILGKHTVVYPLKNVLGVHKDGEIISSF